MSAALYLLPLAAGKSTLEAGSTIYRFRSAVNVPSDDPIMCDCHERAAKNGAGIVVYSDPIEDA